MLDLLRREGWHVTQRMVNHAETTGAVPKPARVGNYRQWLELHVAALRDYLRTRSRSQRPLIAREGRA